MAHSLIAGLRERGYPAASLHVVDPNADTTAALAQAYGVRIHDNANDAIADARLVVLAVKPQVMAQVCAALAPTIGARSITFVSIAAGIRSDQLDAWLGGDRAVVRTMPNTPALLGAGATGLYANARCSAEDRRLAEQVLAAVGITVWLDDETLMDAVTAVSGSGPAYFFRLIQALQAAGEAQGLSPDAARALVVQTALGAARMAAESGEDAGTLRQRVTSPGGTTAAAMAAFDHDRFEDIIANAVSAATERGRELAAGQS